MIRRAPKLVLGVATVMLALLDWFAVPTEADAPMPVVEFVEPDVPEELPAGPNLERPDATTAQFGLVSVAIDTHDGTYVLRATNAGKNARELAIEVGVWEQSGEMYARMVPPAVKVASEVVTIRVPASGGTSRVLHLEGISTPRTDVQNASVRVPAANRAQAGFRARTLRITQVGTASQATQATRPVRVLRQPVASRRVQSPARNPRIVNVSIDF